jgi:H+-transporting ATPase
MLTGSFVVSPMLIVLLLLTNDFVTMTIATDGVQPAPKPQRWAVRRLVGAAGVFAALSLLFSFSVHWWTRDTQGLSLAQTQMVVGPLTASAAFALLLDALKRPLFVRVAIT